MAAPLLPRADGQPHTPAAAWAAVGWALPAIELAFSRVADYPAHATAALALADCALSGACVLGARLPAASVDPAGLGADAAVTLTLNGAPAARGSGAAIMGNPTASLAWLANALNARGRALAEGDVVMTGAAALRAAPLQPGDVLGATFAGLRPAGDGLATVGCTIAADAGTGAPARSLM